MFKVIGQINKEGRWSYKDKMVKDEFYALAWIIEFLLICVPAVVITAKKVKENDVTGFTTIPEKEQEQIRESAVLFNRGIHDDSERRTMVSVGRDSGGMGSVGMGSAGYGMDSAGTDSGGMDSAGMDSVGMDSVGMGSVGMGSVGMGSVGREPNENVQTPVSYNSFDDRNNNNN